MDAIETVTFLVALLAVVLGIFNTWYLFKSARFRLKVVPKLCFDMQGGRYLAIDWDEQVQQLRAAGAPSRWGIEVVNLNGFAVTIDEIGFSDNTDDGQMAMVDPEISRRKRWPVRLKPREKVMYYSTDGMDLPKTVLANPRAYAKTDCGHCVYGTSPVLTKEARIMLRDTPVPLAKPRPTLSNEERIYQALVALLRDHKESGSVVLVEEPRSQKFVQFGPGSSLEIDVPHMALNNEEAERAYDFFARLGGDYLMEYDAPNPQTGKVAHGATFNHDFAQDARAAAKAGVAFFQEVYLLPPDVELRVERRF